MALDFPSNTDFPYVDPVSGLKYIFNSAVGGWEAAIQPPAIVSTSAPDIDIPGFLWWDDVGGSLYIYYKDDDSSQWVEAVPTGSSQRSAVADVGTTAPPNPVNGELWWSTNAGALYVYFISDSGTGSWLPSSPGQSFLQQGRSRITTFSSATSPSGTQANDLWYNTTDNTLYINNKNGSADNWVKTHSINDSSILSSITGTGSVNITSGTTPVISINDATTSTSGVVKIASVADSTGKSNDHVLTPKVLSESIASYYPSASRTEVGVMKLASRTDVVDGTDNTKAITPLVLKQSLDILSNIPIGAVTEFAAATAPTGYLKCDGSLVSRTTYSALFQVIGVTYGIGDGVTTFALPNISGDMISIIKF